MLVLASSLSVLAPLLSYSKQAVLLHFWCVWKSNMIRHQSSSHCIAYNLSCKRSRKHYHLLGISKNPADVIYPVPKKLTFLEIEHSMLWLSDYISASCAQFLCMPNADWLTAANLTKLLGSIQCWTTLLFTPVQRHSPAPIVSDWNSESVLFYLLSRILDLPSLLMILWEFT